MTDIARVTLKKLLRKSMIGPQNEIFCCDQCEEIVLGYPADKYFTGMIFPRFYPVLVTDEDEEDVSVFDLLEEKDYLLNYEDMEPDEHVSPKEEVENEESFERPELYPNTFGVSFCIEADADTIDINLSFGSYRQIDPTKEIGENNNISIKKTEFDLIKNIEFGENSRLKDLLFYDIDSKAVRLKRLLSGQSYGRATGDFLSYRGMRNKVLDRLKESKGDERIIYETEWKTINKVAPLFRKTWERKQHSIIMTLNLNELDNSYVLSKAYRVSDFLEFKIHAQLISLEKDIRVVKVLVENTSNITSGRVKTVRTVAINSATMFQSSLKLSNSQLLPFVDLSSDFFNDIEDQIVQCQYRDLGVYAKSYNCACSWHRKDNDTVIETEFMPSSIPHALSHTVLSKHRSCMNVYRISLYSDAKKDDIIKDLHSFVDDYEYWSNDQENQSGQFAKNDIYFDGAKTIIDRQKIALARMRKGVDLLEDDTVFELFRLANSAMFVNMKKLDYSKKNIVEKHCDDVYYRPFQLAFFLINLESLINPESEFRKNIVDLLWFPTGGGKTEAYFLVAAFSLLHRRRTKDKKGLGTSVIMRYTMRLLTAQQFERASRLILSINYVCSFFCDDLVSHTPFSIGLWIGQSTSPNRLLGESNSAASVIANIVDADNEDLARRNNIFPLSHCPWCDEPFVRTGCSAFSYSPNRFLIKCLNKSCHFTVSREV